MTRKKYEKPLTLDMEFDEALGRIVQTDPDEVAENMRAAQQRGLSVRNRRISEDDDGNICLTDLWELAGSPANARPVDWHRHKRTEALETALRTRMVEKLHLLPDELPPTFHAGKGRGAKSFAHPVLALDYAELLEPALGVEIREIFLRYRANDVSLANDILDRIIEQVREDELRVTLRDQTSARNKALDEQGKKAGCEERWEYAELHNAGYRGLYNGLDAKGVHRLKKLTKNQKILDHMSAAETAANAFWITQAALRMKRDNPQTPEEAFAITSDAGERTRQAMEEIGGVMPEDMPVPDSISSAKRRLKKNKAILGEANKLDKKG